MLLTTKRYMFYVDTDSTIHFSTLANSYQSVPYSSAHSLDKTLTDGRSFVGGLLRKLTQKRQRAVKDYINTLLP